jgi:hypothetical protein
MTAPQTWRRQHRFVPGNESVRYQTKRESGTLRRNESTT